MRSLRLLVVLIMLFLSQGSFAWSPKEYATLTRLTAIDLLKPPATRLGPAHHQLSEMVR